MKLEVVRRSNEPLQPGGVLEGHLRISNPKPNSARSIELSFELYEKTEVTRQEQVHGADSHSNSHTKTYHGQIEHVDHKVMLWRSEGGSKFPAGEFYIPFAFRLPGMGMPFTFARDVDLGDADLVGKSPHGVSFAIRAKADIPMWPDTLGHLYALVNNNVQVVPDHQQEEVERDEEMDSGCCGGGRVRIVMNVNKSHIKMQNDEVVVQVKVENQSKRKLKAVVFLNQAMYEEASGFTDEFHKRFAETVAGECLPRQSSDFTVRLHLTNLPVPSTLHTGLLRVRYSIHVDCGRAGCCGRVNALAPVIVGNSTAPEPQGPTQPEVLQPMVAMVNKATVSGLQGNSLCFSMAPMWESDPDAYRTTMVEAKTNMEQEGWEIGKEMEFGSPVAKGDEGVNGEGKDEGEVNPYLKYAENGGDEYELDWGNLLGK